VLAWGHGSGMEQKTPVANPFGQKPWLDDDPARPNPAYFEHVDHLVDYADRQGLVLAMLPTWGYYVKEAPVLNARNARAYGRWLGARYKDAPNVVWVNGGDRTPTGFEDVFRELARGLREGDGGVHLVTYHPCGWRSSAQFFHGEDWLDFNMIETWTEWAKIHPAVMSDALRTPRKPVVLGEGAYEDGPEYPQGPITPLVVRRQAWWTVMAGGFHTYGQNQMWRMEPGWDKTFDTPGAAQVCLMRRIFTELPWPDLIPDQGVFASGVGSERTLNAAMRARDGSRILVYLSSPTTVFLHLDKIEAKTARATWISPSPPPSRSSSKLRTSGRTPSSCWKPSRISPRSCPDLHAGMLRDSSRSSVSGYLRTSQIRAAAWSFGLLRPCSQRSRVLGFTPSLKANTWRDIWSASRVSRTTFGFSGGSAMGSTRWVRSVRRPSRCSRIARTPDAISRNKLLWLDLLALAISYFLLIARSRARCCFSSSSAALRSRLSFAVRSAASSLPYTVSNQICMSSAKW